MQLSGAKWIKTKQQLNYLRTKSFRAKKLDTSIFQVEFQDNWSSKKG